jgi:hypothetical protein
MYQKMAVTARDSGGSMPTPIPAILVLTELLETDMAPAWPGSPEVPATIDAISQKTYAVPVTRGRHKFLALADAAEKYHSHAHRRLLCILTFRKPKSWSIKSLNPL